jgi:prepilin signal peptidase PulO-like enzyme (type II secretory pathway)
MAPLLLALIGIPVGFALDALVARLAVPIERDDEPGAPVSPGATLAALQRETGALVVTSPAQVWVRRALIVAVTAALFAVAGLRFDEPGHLAIVTTYICVLVVCAATDLLSYRVPNAITYPAIVGAIVAGAFMPDANVKEVLAGGLLAGGVLLVPALVTGGVGMGMGDVKLAAFVGLAVGFTKLVPALLGMALLGGGAATFLLATRLRRRGEPIPYAPFISAGALAALFWQGAAFVTLT